MSWPSNVEEGVHNCAPSGLLAGVARSDISPALGIAQMNWGAATHVESLGVDPAGLYATAIVFSDREETLAIASIDIVEIKEQFSTPVIERVAALTGMKPEHILLNASHTHSGARIRPEKVPPGRDVRYYADVVDRYNAQVVDRVVGAIVSAHGALQPVHIHGGSGVGTININRRFAARGGNPPAVGRNPDGFVDREVVVFRIDDAKGRPLAILANYQAHPTVLGYANRVISPDYIGGMRQTVETAFPGVLCLYLQGAAGDQGPVEGFSGDLGVAHRLGHILGHQVAAVAHQIETVEREPTFEGYVESLALQSKEPWRVKGPRSSILRFSATIVDVPRRRYSEAEISQAEGRLRLAEGQLADSEADGNEQSKQQATARVQRYTSLLKWWTQAPKRAEIQVELQAMRIGDVAVVAIAAQPFARIGAMIKENSPFVHTMFVAFSDGIYDGIMPGAYMPTTDEYSRGGYEVDMTPYGPGADKIVIDSAVSLLRSLQ